MSGIALVTGANRGIGKEVSAQLHDRGWTVVMGSRDLARGVDAARSIALSARLIPLQLDVSNDESVTRAAQWVTANLGGLDALVNNAGAHYDSGELAITADLAIVHQAMQTNLFGAWRTCQAFRPLLTLSEHPRIVNVSSEAGSISQMNGGLPAYSTSKAALNALTRLLAGEVADERILVNAVCPGWTDTDMGRGGRPVRDGAAGIIWAVELPDEGSTGGFFRDGRPLAW